MDTMFTTEFWVQLIAIVGSIAGGMWGIAKVLLPRMVETKMAIQKADHEAKLRQLEKETDARIEQARLEAQAEAKRGEHEISMQKYREEWYIEFTSKMVESLTEAVAAHRDGINALTKQLQTLNAHNEVTRNILRTHTGLLGEIIENLRSVQIQKDGRHDSKDHD